jgi:uncharacterized protein YlzI (FlbEa/FlbD family)
MFSDVQTWCKEIDTKKLHTFQQCETDMIVEMDRQFHFKGFMLHPTAVVTLTNGEEYIVEAKTRKFDRVEDIVQYVKSFSLINDIYPHLIYSQLWALTDGRKYIFAFGEVSKSYGKE